MVSVQPVGIASPLQSIEEAPFDLRAHAAGSKPRIELLLIQENADLKRLGDDFMKCLLQQFKRESGASNLGFEKQLSVLQEQAQVLDTKSSLSTLSTISSSVLSLFSLAAGASTANVYLVAAGATGLANTLITYFDGWNWIAETLASDNEQAQGQIRTLMPITLTLMSFALGMNGTQLAGGETQGMLDTFQQLKSYVYGGVEAGKAYNTYQMGKIDSQLVESNRDLTLHERKVAALSRELSSWIDLLRQISSQSKQAVKQAIRETNAVAQGV